MKLGDVLKRERLRSGLILKEVSEKTRMDLPTLSRIENNRAMPMGDQLESLSNIYALPKEKTDKLVSAEYGLKCPKTVQPSERKESIYKLTVCVPRELANAFLALLKDENESVKGWLLKTVNRKIKRAQKKTAGAGTPTIQTH